MLAGANVRCFLLFCVVVVSLDFVLWLFKNEIRLAFELTVSRIGQSTRAHHAINSFIFCFFCSPRWFSRNNDAGETTTTNTKMPNQVHSSYSLWAVELDLLANAMCQVVLSRIRWDFFFSNFSSSFVFRVARAAHEMITVHRKNRKKSGTTASGHNLTIKMGSRNETMPF